MEDKETQPSSPEIWVPCPGYIRYEVSSMGRFRNARTERIVTKRINKRNGYRIINLYPNIPGTRSWKHITVRTAPLIALAFLGPKPDHLPQIDHLHGKHREAATDLDYCSQETNIQRSFDRGGRKTGKSNPLTQAQHDKIKELWATGEYSQVAIGRIVGLTNGGVSRILSGRSRGPRPPKGERQARPKPRSTVMKDRLAARLREAAKHIEEAGGHLTTYKLGRLMGCSQPTAHRYIHLLKKEQTNGQSDSSTEVHVPPSKAQAAPGSESTV